VQSDARTVSIDAKPEPLQIALNLSAVLVVDMQNDFGARGGMFDRAGIDIAPIERVVGPTARVLDVARAAGLTVIYLVMQFSPDLADAGGSKSPIRSSIAPWLWEKLSHRMAGRDAFLLRAPGTQKSFRSLPRGKVT